MDITRETLNEIENYLTKEGLYCEFVEQYIDLPVVEINIAWGDWKHEHLRLKHLMDEFGWHQIGEEETETDGSDCYSATHYFMKKAA